MEKSDNTPVNPPGPEAPPPPYPYNPNFNPPPGVVGYPSAPPSTGFQAPYFNNPSSIAPASGDIGLAMNLSSNIAQNGRSQVFTVCPHCHSQITTRIETSKNGQVDSAVQSQKCCIMVEGLFFALFALGGALAFTIFSGMWIALIPAGLMSLAAVGMSLFTVNRSQDAVDITCTDVAHFCPHCGHKLGISDGYEAFQRERMIAAMTSHHHRRHHHHY